MIKNAQIWYYHCPVHIQSISTPTFTHVHADISMYMQILARISNPFPPLISLIYMQILARWDLELCSQLRQSSWHSNYNGQKGSNKLFSMKSNYLFELQTELLFFRLLAMQKDIMQKIFQRSKLRTKWKTRKMYIW